MHVEKYCRHCGGELVQGATFCQNCGASTAYSPTPPAPQVAVMPTEKLPRPTGVTILAILGILGGILEMLIGVLLLIVGAAVFGISEAVLSPIIATVASILAIILIGFGLFDLIVFRGLWNGRNWARILVIIMEVLGVIGSVVTLFAGQLGGIVGIIIGGVILYYLFRPNVKAYFGIQSSSRQAPA